MSIFAGLNVKLVEDKALSSRPLPQTVPPSVFDGLNVAPVETGGNQIAPPEEDTWGQFAARTGKSVLAGVGGGVVDTATALYNIPAALSNGTKEARQGASFEVDPISGMPIAKPEGEAADLPLIPSLTEAIDRRIDEGIDNYTRTPEEEKWFQEGVKFAASVASGGGLGALAGKFGLTGAQTALKVAGSTKPSVITGAAVSGVALEKAHENEVSAPLAFGGSIGAGLATEAALTLLNPKNMAKTGTALLGFGKNNLNIPAVDAANALNIDLPAIAATNGVAPAFAHQTLGKFPYLGDTLKGKISTASEQYQTAWNRMLDSVGPSATEETSKAIDKSYRQMRANIPEGATVTPQPILDAIASIEGKLKATVHSDPTKKLFGICQEFKKALAPPSPQLLEGFGKLPASIQETILKALPVPEAIPIPVKDLVRQKVELNKIMRDRNLFDRTDTDSLSFLHELRDGVTKALDTYGATNPRFRKALGEADSLFAKAAKRQALDVALAGKVVDPKTGEVAYNGLLGILTDRKQQKFLRNNLGEAQYKKLEEFITVAKAMESIKRNNPNPSGSATMGAAIGVIASILSGKLTIPATVLGGGTATTKLLTSKKFLNHATEFARQPTEPLAQKLAAVVQENTGMTIEALVKAAEGDSRDQATP